LPHSKALNISRNIPDLQMVYLSNQVLNIQSSNIQARTWELALLSQNITVISGSPEISFVQIIDIFQNSKLNLPSLILVDLHLKNLNAYEFCCWCNENHPSIKVIVTSAVEIVSPYDRHVAIDHGAWDLLPRTSSESLDDVNFRNSFNKVLKHLGDLQPVNDSSVRNSSEEFDQSLSELLYLPVNIEGSSQSDGQCVLQSVILPLKQHIDSSSPVPLPSQEQDSYLLKKSQDKNFTNLSNLIPRFRLLFFIAVLVLSGLGILLWVATHSNFNAVSSGTDDSSVSSQNTLTPKVVARGTIIPEWDVIKLSVSNAQDSRVDRIFVKQGDHVEVNQVIAVLQGAQQRKVDLDAARVKVELLQAKLEKVEQGDAKPAELSVQQAVIDRLEAQFSVELRQKQSEIDSALSSFNEATTSYERSQSLYSKGAISKADLDKARRDFETSQATLDLKQADLAQSETTFQNQISEEKAKLVELQQVRPIDVKIMQKELEQAVLEADRSRVNYEDTLVRVPVGGQILRINTKVGEQVNTQLGIVDLGRTQKMYVQAEVYESDLPNVRKGQRANIISEYGGFEGEIYGTVETVDLQVGQPTLSEGKNNPTTDDNSRVVQVSIRIDPKDSLKVSGLTKMQVRVTIEPIFS
jgi:HlyD family secretion protein